MKVPNWQHHSKKDAKRKLKPQALRQARARRNQLIKCLLKTSSRRKGSYSMYIHEEPHELSQGITSKITCPRGLDCRAPSSQYRPVQC
ncbi:MAG: hypothetical protein CMA59_00745 [Euryarchaeota archaeon]|nr:hypothetical protein [Euryarchaeota archaeon]